MTLGDLIKYLKAQPPNKVLPIGFTSPHSYRGYYECLAFEPVENVLVGNMLEDAITALGATFQGYKGGDYTMKEHTECYLANYGDCGEELGYTLLLLMLNATEIPPRLTF